MLLAPSALALGWRPVAASGPDFVVARGNQFTLRGAPVVVKGANYYQRDTPWAAIWREWRGSPVEREVAIGTERLGLNALRVLVPYGATWLDG